jgi:uncharacterized protein YndB with AHSA1/START domain
MTMAKTKFVYVTYIASTPEKVFQAITEPGLARQYWGMENVSDWKPGSPWRLVISWAWPQEAADRTKRTRVAFDLERIDTMVKLTVTHDELDPGSDMERGITEGWPRVLSSLKSFLETGKPLDTWAGKK